MDVHRAHDATSARDAGRVVVRDGRVRIACGRGLRVFCIGCVFSRRNRKLVVDVVSEERFRMRRELCVIRVENASQTPPVGREWGGANAETCHRDARVDR